MRLHGTRPWHLGRAHDGLLCIPSSVTRRRRRLLKNASGALTTSTYDAANQLQTSIDATGATNYTFDAAGNQQIVAVPSGTTTNTWDYENQQIGVQLPDGSLVTMLYNANFRRVRKES